jgi:ABC-2 type transport system permease protein
MKTFAWLVRREFWENRAIWIVPAAIGVLLMLAALFGKVQIDLVLTTPDQNRAVGGTVLFAFGITFFAVMSIYSSWYLLDCLYADRKDRSILFWKSMPITDMATVLSKLFTGLIAIPLVYFAAADVATLLIAFILSVRAHSTWGAALWQPDVWLQLQALWLYLIITSAIWYLPFAGWFLAVSAFANRAVVLLSLAVPLSLFLLERWFFGSHAVASVIVERALGYPAAAFHDMRDHHAWVTTMIDRGSITTPASVWSLLDPVGFFASPATWVGVLVGAGFIAAAIQLRLRRTEI